MCKIRKSRVHTGLLTLLLAVTLTSLFASSLSARVWSIHSGGRRVEGEFVTLDNGFVQLRGTDGIFLAIPLKKFSPADRKHIATLTGTGSTPSPQPEAKADKPPAKPGNENAARFQLVIAEGVGRKKGDAMKNAQRTAVRQALVQLVAVTDQLKHDTTIEKQVLAKAANFVDKHKVLDSSRKSGIYHAKVKAQLNHSDIAAALTEAGVPLLPKELRLQYTTAGKRSSADSPELVDSVQENPWAIRTAEHRAAALKANGGNEESEAAVAAGLAWLARHQNRDGSWSFNYTQGGRCRGFPDPGEAPSRMGATGLSLLAFLGAGHTHKQKGDYQKTVRAGLAYLVTRIQPTGLLYEKTGSSHQQYYTHGMAACALAEAYGMTKDKKLKKAVQASINFLDKTQSKSVGGWRYGIGDPGDTSVVGWQNMAFKSAKMAGIEFPNSVYSKTMKYLDEARTKQGEYTYEPGHALASSHGTTAIGLLCRLYMGWPQDHEEFKSGLDYITKKGFNPKDIYYNYYASQFLFQAGGPQNPDWKKWNPQIRDSLINTQDSDDKRNRQGSWFIEGDKFHNGATFGGRLYHTAMATMILQTYYRYPRFFDQK